MATPNPSEPPVSLSLHDSLALGDVEFGLLAEKQQRSEMEEIHRLPVLLRLLSSSRPLSSVPRFPPNNSQEHDEEEEGASSSSTAMDELANEVVARLEDVAAGYSVAEGVDVVACHLAPTICRRLSKLPPLKRKRGSGAQQGCEYYTRNNNNSSGSGTTTEEWETKDLVMVGSLISPRSRFKRRRISETQSSLRDPTDSADELNNNNNLEAEDLASEDGVGGLSSDEEGKMALADTASGGKNSNNKRRASRRSSEPNHTASAGAEDSQEEVVSKTLSDLSALVVASLEPIRAEKSDSGGGGDETAPSRKGNLSLTVDDSALSEPSRGQTTTVDGVGDVMTGSDLGATVASLMHHAPVLRHRHVANALCRASIPQAANLVKRIGANCPSAVPSLLRGCIEAYQSASRSHSGHSNIKHIAKSTVRALAKLSDREKSRIRTTLQRDGVMIDLQLELAMSQDPVSASCLLLQHLAASNASTGGIEEATLEDQMNTSAYADNPEQYATNVSGEISNDTQLKSLLQNDPKLLLTTVQFLKGQISVNVKKEELQCFGQISLILRSFTWMLLLCDIEKCAESSDKVLSAFVSSIPVLRAVIGKTKSSSTEADRARSGELGVTNALCLSLCTSILLFARLTSLKRLGQSARNDCEEYVKECFSSGSVTPKYDIFLASLGCPLRDGCVKAVYTLLKNAPLQSLGFNCSALELRGSLEEGLSKTCQWIKDNVNLDLILTEDCYSQNPSALLDMMRASEDTDGSIKTKIKGSLTEVLIGTKHESSMAPEKMAEFVVKAAAFLAKKSTSINYPVVSSLELETLASKVDLHLLEGTPAPGSAEYRFLFQVLYWFAFVDTDTKDSLFTFDARALPLKEVLSCCARLASSAEENSSSLHFYLNRLIAKQCPEVLLQTRRWELVKVVRVDLLSRQKYFGRTKFKKFFSDALKSALAVGSSDPSGLVAERAFLLARGKLSDSELVTATVSSIFSRPHSPLPFYTYSTLCRDPLILLKAPMRVWQCRGLRRIVLSILFCLLETNNAIIQCRPPSDTVADDLIASRNLLLLRCVLIAVSGSEESGTVEHSPYSCCVASNFLRLMVAKNRGLMGVLIKQSPTLPECALDWMVEFIPETMDDSQALISVLSERGSLSSRLTGAAAILRIAIAHGQRDESASEAMVYAALSQLISSFFLVVGPVGVPVNVLIGDGPDQDVTQTTRRATFRMLRSLVNVRGRLRTRLRGECGMALSKLAGLCKGENIVSGVAGAVVSRRKNLLREVFEAVSKASNAMGSGTEL